VGAADPADGVLDVVVVPAGSRISLARRAYGMRTCTLERQRDVPHARGAVVEVELEPGTEVNCDGERRRGGLERVTVTAGAYSLIVPG
jgi:diacylglycerol kinase family enzyme